MARDIASATAASEPAHECPCRRPHDRRQAPEHPVHHGRRPRRACDRLLRPRHQPHAAHRPHRGRGRAPGPLLRQQLDLHAQPCGHPDRHLQPRQRRHDAGRRHRQPPAPRGQAPAFGRLPDRHRRQVAPGRGAGALPDGLRPLVGRARAGRLLRPRLPRGRWRGAAPGLRHRRHHRPVPAVAGRTRCVAPLLPDVPPQGAAPLLGEPPEVRRPLHRGRAGAGELRRRLPAPRRGRRRGQDAHRRRPDLPRPRPGAARGRP